MAPQADEEQPLAPQEHKKKTYNASSGSCCPPQEQHDETVPDNWESLPSSHDPTIDNPVKITKNHLLLLVVATLYGTLNVSVRAVYDLPDPPSASVLSTVRGWLAVLGFVPMLWHQKRGAKSEERQSLLLSEDEWQARLGRTGQGFLQDLPPGLWKVAAELALWNFGLQALTNVGLVFVQAARAAFFTQLSVVVTPMISAAAGHRVRGHVWRACFIALVGLVLLSNKANSGDDGDSDTTRNNLDLTLSLGDILCLMGAISWSIYVFRVSAIGDAYDEVTLQAVKNLILASFYTIWFLVDLVVTGERQWLGWTSLASWVILFYSALGPGTIADIVQQKAQSTVTATVANIILSSEPISAAIFGRFLLGEVTTWSEKLGGCFILIAAVVATRE